MRGRRRALAVAAACLLPRATESLVSLQKVCMLWAWIPTPPQPRTPRSSRPRSPVTSIGSELSGPSTRPCSTSGPPCGDTATTDGVTNATAPQPFAAPTGTPTRVSPSDSPVEPLDWSARPASCLTFHPSTGPRLSAALTPSSTPHRTPAAGPTPCGPAPTTSHLGLRLDPPLRAGRDRGDRRPARRQAQHGRPVAHEGQVPRTALDGRRKARVELGSSRGVGKINRAALTVAACLLLASTGAACEDRRDPVTQAVEWFPLSQQATARCIVWLESSNRADTIGSAGERGYFQIHPVHRRDYEAYTGKPWSTVAEPVMNGMYAVHLWDEVGHCWSPTWSTARRCGV